MHTGIFRIQTLSDWKSHLFKWKIWDGRSRLSKHRGESVGSKHFEGESRLSKVTLTEKQPFSLPKNNIPALLMLNKSSDGQKLGNWRTVGNVSASWIAVAPLPLPLTLLWFLGQPARLRQWPVAILHSSFLTNLVFRAAIFLPTNSPCHSITNPVHGSRDSKKIPAFLAEEKAHSGASWCWGTKFIFWSKKPCSK